MDWQQTTKHTNERMLTASGGHHSHPPASTAPQPVTLTPERLNTTKAAGTQPRGHRALPQWAAQAQTGSLHARGRHRRGGQGQAPPREPPHRRNESGTRPGLRAEPSRAHEASRRDPRGRQPQPLPCRAREAATHGGGSIWAAEDGRWLAEREGAGWSDGDGHPRAGTERGFLKTPGRGRRRTEQGSRRAAGTGAGRGVTGDVDGTGHGPRRVRCRHRVDI